jgi:glucose-1-phosphate adenylyltransferase
MGPGAKFPGGQRLPHRRQSEKQHTFQGRPRPQGASIKDSIILQKCEIEGKASLDTVILDKEAFVSAGEQLKGSKEDPLVIGKGVKI